MNTQFSTTHVTRDVIARRARELWEAQGCPPNRDVDIWLEAERELASPAATKPPLTSQPRPVDVQPTTQPSALVDKPLARPRRRKIAADEINPDEVQERLDDFGDPGRRSPTSANLP